MKIFPLLQTLVENASPSLRQFRVDSEAHKSGAPIPRAAAGDVGGEVEQLKLNAIEAATGNVPTEVLDFLEQLISNTDSDDLYGYSQDENGPSAWVIPELAVAAYRRSTAKRSVVSPTGA